VNSHSRLAGSASRAGWLGSFTRGCCGKWQQQAPNGSATAKARPQAPADPDPASLHRWGRSAHLDRLGMGVSVDWSRWEAAFSAVPSAPFPLPSACRSTRTRSPRASIWWARCSLPTTRASTKN